MLRVSAVILYMEEANLVQGHPINFVMHAGMVADL
jgi:hypothetical protein